MIKESLSKHIGASAFLNFVSACPLASNAKHPHLPSSLVFNSLAKFANDKPEEPAPWWKIKMGIEVVFDNNEVGNV